MICMEEESDKANLPKSLYDFCRYCVAFFVISYGWAKIMGSQFTILDSELDKPMREVSGFWLTWYYFGYSPFYGNLIALVQIACGFLLLYRKSVLLASCILFGVLGNIVLVDIFYGVDPSGLFTAIFLQTGVIIILSYHRQELKDFFWNRQNSVFARIKNTKKVRWLKICLIAIFIFLPPACTYYIANYNNRFPTEIDGSWRVLNASNPVLDGGEPLTKIYFEYNRAFMTVFRFGDNKWRTHHFEINPETKEINIWKEWLSKNGKVFTGKYQIINGKMILDGAFTDSERPVKIELSKE